jgi:glutamine amidotransferase
MIAIIDLSAEETDFLVNTIENFSEKFKITTDEAEIIKSDRIILTASDDTSYALRQMHLFNLFTVLRICRKPFLAICSGMHLLADHAENSSESFLGIFPVGVRIFDNKSAVPFKGLHSISFQKESKLFNGIPDGENFYFNNSYYIPVNEYTTSAADNNVKFSASMEKDNYYCIQFCPYKSGGAGIKLLHNFFEIQH